MTGSYQVKMQIDKINKNLEIIFETIPDGLVITDLDAGIVDANPAAIRLMGVPSKQEIIKQNILDFLLEEEKIKARIDFKSILTAGRSENQIYRMGTKDRGELSVEMNASLLKDTDGRNIGFLVVFRPLFDPGLMKSGWDPFTKPLPIHFHDIIGKSESMQKIFRIIQKVADKDTTVLIEGETGTGKELIAQALHQRSNRRDNIFIPVNCGALTESLLESELFGHEKGAFSGAVSRKFGIFETADKGTVFLDEINNASMNVQAKLLRLIEKGEFIRVGGNEVIRCDIRLLASSNQRIADLVEEKKFREDLYHRLNVVEIIVPPLRVRKEDIPLMIGHFLEQYNKKFNKQARLHEKTIRHLIRYSWPGNVRELLNLIQSLVLLNQTGLILPHDLPEAILGEEMTRVTSLSFKSIKEKVVTDFEARYFKALLKETSGNVSRAAKTARMSRRLLIDKLKLYHITPSSFKI
ncbi:MAG: sigma 54-interacting transcriptional regulator [bacterium]|nr:sigma 54-interacting transcriptional regulator [bacterium]